MKAKVGVHCMFQSPSVTVEGFYRMLGVEEGASESEIKSAFRERTKEVHPDQNDDEKADEEFDFLKKSREVVELIEVEGMEPQAAVAEVYNESGGISQEKDRRNTSRQETPEDESTDRTASTNRSVSQNRSPTADVEDVGGPAFLAFAIVGAASLVTILFTRFALMPEIPFEKGVMLLGGAGLLMALGGHFKINSKPPVDAADMDLTTRFVLATMVHLAAVAVVYGSTMAGTVVDVIAYASAGTVVIWIPIASYMAGLDVKVLVPFVWIGAIGGLSRPFLWLDFSPFLLGLVVNLVFGAILALLVFASVFFSLDFYLTRPILHEPGLRKYSRYGWAILPMLLTIGISFAAAAYTPWYAIWGFIAAPLVLMSVALVRGAVMRWDLH